MEKVVILVLGRDRPGIVAAVSRTLSESGCNIEDISQTTLQNEFAGIFIATLPINLHSKDLLDRLREELQPLDVDVLIKKLAPSDDGPEAGPSAPFVITAFGSDRLGLVSGLTEVIAVFGVNITNLQAVFRGGDDPYSNVMIYEVDVPMEIEHDDFRLALQKRAEKLGLDLNLQHRDIFEAIRRV